MKINRTKNATRNIMYGVLLHIYQTLVPFMMRTATIYYLGMQYLGLNGLFSSVLSVLNMAELGVGSAMVYSMYKPIAEDDTYTICALMRLYRIYYRAIGVVIAIIGGILTPFIPRLINGTIPNELNIYVLYLLNLIATVLSYWLFAYKNCLLTAHQRNDVVSKITILVNTGLYASQLLVISVFHNYYLYVIAALASQAFINILTATIVNKMYPQYSPKGKLAQEKIKSINRRVMDLFTSKIGTVVVNSVDTIVVSAFLGLTMLAIYQNYFYIMNSVITFIGIIMTSCRAGIGNSLITETRLKNYNDLNKLTFIICWISGFGATCFLCLYQPFMLLWVGENYLLPFSAVVCLCIYFFVFEINRLLNTFKDAGGIWHEDRFRPLITALGNLIMNIIMVQRWGIYGIILSTVLSMLLIGMPWLLYNLFTTIFDLQHLKEYLLTLFYYTGISVIACIVTWRLCNLLELNLFSNFIVRVILCCIIPNFVFFVLYRKNPIYRECKALLFRISNVSVSIKHTNNN